MYDLINREQTSSGTLHLNSLQHLLNAYCDSWLDYKKNN